MKSVKDKPLPGQYWLFGMLWFIPYILFQIGWSIVTLGLIVFYQIGLGEDSVRLYIRIYWIFNIPQMYLFWRLIVEHSFDNRLPTKYLALSAITLFSTLLVRAMVTSNGITYYFYMIAYLAIFASVIVLSFLVGHGFTKIGADYFGLKSSITTYFYALGVVNAILLAIWTITVVMPNYILLLLYSSASSLLVVAMVIWRAVLYSTLYNKMRTQQITT